jgi:proteasome lid subunit RPN8/RPN11
MKHPNEGILILKGKSRNGEIKIDGLAIPPFNFTGPTFAGFPHSFLPFDNSYIGIVHSHPVGSAEPSVTDLNNFFGLISLIIKNVYTVSFITALIAGLIHSLFIPFWGIHTFWPFFIFSMAFLTWRRISFIKGFLMANAIHLLYNIVPTIAIILDTLEASRIIMNKVEERDIFILEWTN